MALNKFLEFNEQKNEMQTDEQYNADTQRIGGLQTGLARTVLHNKLFRQASVMASALGKVVADLGKNADDTSRDTLAQNIKDTMLAANNHALSAATSGLFGVGNVDDALKKISSSCRIFGNMVAFTKNTVDKTWVVPTNVNKIRIFACASGAGILAGEYLIGDMDYSVTPGETIDITVGDGNTIISGGGLTQTLTLAAGAVSESLYFNFGGYIVGTKGEDGDSMTTGEYIPKGGAGGAFGAGGGAGGETDSSSSTDTQPGGRGGSAHTILGGNGGGRNPRTVVLNGKDGRKATNHTPLIELLPDLLTSGGGGGAGRLSVSAKGGASGSGNLGGVGAASASGNGGGGGGAGGYGAGGGGVYRYASADTIGKPSPGMVLIVY